MKRNFFRSGIQELEQIVLERGLSANLDDIIHELSFRSTKRAKKLLESINQNNSSQNIHSKEKVETNKSLKDPKDNTNNNSDTQKFETTFKRSDFKQSANENNYQNKKKI